MSPSTSSQCDAMDRHQLLLWDQLPEWQQEDSHHIESGYRVATPSMIRCISTWLYLHNESVNIFSHLFGAILFFTLPFALYPGPNRIDLASNDGATIVTAIYLFSVAICFLLSAAFHTLMSHSARGFAFGLQLDFQGVILLIWSATVPLVFFTFQNEPRLQRIYWSIASFFALAASIITFTPAFRKPATKPLRAAVFGSLALSTAASIVHGVIAHGWSGQSYRFPMWSVGSTLLVNTIGGLLYVLRYPERSYPLRFDLFGASHQIMHFAVVAAGILWLAGVMVAYDHACCSKIGTK